MRSCGQGKQERSTRAPVVPLLGAFLLGGRAGSRCSRETRKVIWTAPLPSPACIVIVVAQVGPALPAARSSESPFLTRADPPMAAAESVVQALLCPRPVRCRPPFLEMRDVFFSFSGVLANLVPPLLFFFGFSTDVCVDGKKRWPDPEETGRQIKWASEAIAGNDFLRTLLLV